MRKSPDKLNLLPDSDVKRKERRRSALYDSMNLPPIKEENIFHESKDEEQASGINYGDIDEASSSGYETVPKEPMRQFLNKSYSVPNLHSRSKLEEEAREIDAKHLHISYISDSKNFILYPGDGAATINNLKPSSGSETDSVSTKQEKHITGRTAKILKHLDGVKNKVETELYRGGLSVLKDQERFPFVILKGTGCGANFAAKMLFAKLLRDDPEADGYCFNDPKECWCLNPDKRSIILGLEISGSNYYNVDLLSQWFDWLKENMPIGSIRNNNMVIILTIKDHKEMKEFRPLQLYSGHVIDANEEKYRPSIESIQALELSVMEQHNVKIRRMMVATSNSNGYLRVVDQDVVDKIPSVVGRIGHVHKLNDFFQNHLSMGIDYFRAPEPRMVRQLRHYARTRPAFFLPLLAVYAHRGKLGIGRLNQMARINHDNGRFWQSVQNISTEKQMDKLEHRLKDDFPECMVMYQYARKHSFQANLVTNLEKFAEHIDGVYLDKRGNEFQFMNGIVYYSFLVVLCEIYPESMKTCERDFFFRYIKPLDENAEPDTCLRVDTSKHLDDSTVKNIMVRFKDEIIEERQVAKSMAHAVMYPVFFEKFLQYLSRKRKLTWKVLSQLDADRTNPYCCLFYGLQNNGIRSGTNSNNTDVIIRHGKWIKKREDKNLKVSTYLQEQETLRQTVEWNITGTFKALIDMGVQMPVKVLEIAIDHQNTSIIDCILKKGKFTNLEWYHEVIHALDVLSIDIYLPDLLHQTKQMMFKVDLGHEQMTPYLFHAIELNNVNMVKVLLDEALIPTTALYQRYNGHKPLSEALRLGHVEIVKHLAKYEEIKGQMGVLDEAITTSCICGYDGVVSFLLQQQPCYVHDRNHLEVILFLAVQHGRLDVINVILSAYSDVMVEDKDETNRKTTFSKRPDDAYVKCKLCNSVVPSTPLYVRNNARKSVLHVAAEKGHSTLVSLLVEKGLDVCERDSYDETPLLLACTASHVTTLSVLLKECNRIGYSSDDRTVLRAVQENNIKVLNLLLQYNFNIDFVNDEYGVPIHVATKHKLYDMMRCLLDNGADPDVKHGGWAPIHITAKDGDLQGFRILRSYDADVLQTQGDLQHTFVHIAAKESRTIYADEILKELRNLFDIGSLVNQVNAAGETSLHIAARMGSFSMVNLLLKHGCRPEIRNKSGLRPLDVINTVRQQNKNNWAPFERCKKLLQTKS
ncbi:hypothetical protein ACF0H5_005184 [Mactra antiquata]